MNKFVGDTGEAMSIMASMIGSWGESDEKRGPKMPDFRRSEKGLPRYAIYDLVMEFRSFMERLRTYGIRVPSMSDEQIARSLEAALTEADNMEFGRRRKELRNGE